MSPTAPIFQPSLRRRSSRPPLDIELIDAATEAHEAGRHLEAVQLVFRHVLPGQTIDLAAAPVTFTQGSARVTARLVGDTLAIAVPLVRVGAGGAAIAALRYVLSKINGTGQLYQARLHGDDVVLEFSDPLAALHPQKVLEVLRRMPSEADQHDDWMISQFGASPLERGTVDPIAPDELETAVQVWASHWAFVDELHKEVQRKRSVFFLNETTSYTLTRLRYVLPLGGSVLPRLLEAANTFNDSDVDPDKRESSLGKCIKEMKAIERAELAASLGHVEYAISPLSEGTSRDLTGFFGAGNYMESIDKYRTGGSSIDAAIALSGTYYYLLSTKTWPEVVETAMTEGLAETSGKPWREVANMLYAHAQAMVEEFCDDDEEDGDDEEDEEEEEEGDDE